MDRLRVAARRIARGWRGAWRDGAAARLPFLLVCLPILLVLTPIAFVLHALAPLPPGHRGR
jgi:hypothetical protein